MYKINLVNNFSDTTLGNLSTVTDSSGTVWLSLPDVCRSLGIANPSQAAAQLDASQRAMFPIGRQGLTNFINEAGFYTLTFRSNKKRAREFTGWVAGTVLPTLRTEGRYQLHEQPVRRTPPTERLLARPKSSMTITEAARIVATVVPDATRTMCLELLRDYGLVCKGSTAPTMRGIRRGVVVPRQYALGRPRSVAPNHKQRAGVTTKGVVWLARKCAQRAQLQP